MMAETEMELGYKTERDLRWIFLTPKTFNCAIRNGGEFYEKKRGVGL